MTDKKIQEDYVVTMSARLMNMQAHLIHAGHSKKKIVWYDELTKTNETLTKTNVTDEPTKIDQDTPIEDGLQHKIFKNIKTKQYKQTIQYAQCFLPHPIPIHPTPHTGGGGGGIGCVVLFCIVVLYCFVLYCRPIGYA